MSVCSKLSTVELTANWYKNYLIQKRQKLLLTLENYYHHLDKQ